MDSQHKPDGAKSKPTFLDVAAQVLERNRIPLTPLEIWDRAQLWGLAGPLESEGKTPQKSMYARLLIDVRENKDSRFVEASTRPIRYGLRGQVPRGWVSPELSSLRPKGADDVKERELHPPFVKFALHRLRTYVKTIHHETSSRRRFSKWLHPDLVGIAYPIGEDTRLAIDVASLVGSRPVTLSSYEVKRYLDFSNLREAYFQAVSNSSWAHRGYIVAEKISSDEDFEEELHRLSSSHGIGVIQLDRIAPLDSEVRVEARIRQELDWETMSKLSESNPDFRNFLTSVKIDVEGGVIHPSDYDSPGISDPA